MTPIPSSFDPVEGADGAALTVKGARPKNAAETLASMLKAAAGALLLVLVNLLLPSEDGDIGPVWAMITGRKREAEQAGLL